MEVVALYKKEKRYTLKSVLIYILTELLETFTVSIYSPPGRSCEQCGSNTLHTIHRATPLSLYEDTKRAKIAALNLKEATAWRQ